MSLTITFCNCNGIVMAADRWITGTINNLSFYSTQTAQKLFTTPEGYGISYAGNSAFKGYPASYWMKRFISDLSTQNLDVLEYTQKLCRNFHELDNQRNIIITCAGNKDGTNYVYSGNSTEENVHDFLDNDSSAISVSGESQLALKIIDAIPIERHVLTVMDMIDFVQHIILTTSNIQKFAQTTRTVGPDCDILLIQDGNCKWIVPPPTLINV